MDDLIDMSVGAQRVSHVGGIPNRGLQHCPAKPKNAVSAYFSSKQILPFGSTERCCRGVLLQCNPSSTGRVGDRPTTTYCIAAKSPDGIRYPAIPDHQAPGLYLTRVRGHAKLSSARSIHPFCHSCITEASILSLHLDVIDVSENGIHIVPNANHSP